MDIDTAPLAQLQLWRLISPALPVGAYAYSQGLEYAIDAGWVRGEAGTLDWISGQLRHNLAALDLPILLRLHSAWRCNDLDAMQRWNAILLAARETQELRAEDEHLGSALRRLLIDLGLPQMAAWNGREDRTSFASMFALASAHWEIGAEQAAQGYAWAWCENQIAAAIKLVPLGQTAGQRMVSALLPHIAATVQRATTLSDDDIGSSLPGVSLASALHETQYSRLFRS